jgi:hypothetical protein
MCNISPQILEEILAEPTANQCPADKRRIAHDCVKATSSHDFWELQRPVQRTHRFGARTSEPWIEPSTQRVCDWRLGPVIRQKLLNIVCDSI